MPTLQTASIEIRKAAAIQGIRTGQYEPIFHPDNCTRGSDLVAIVSNSKREIRIDFDDVQAAFCLTWNEINKQK
jgi:hypothetical protein